MQTQPIVGSDVILGVLANLNCHKFVAEQNKIHHVIFQAHRHYAILKNYFVFQPTAVYSYSRSLEVAVDILRNSRVIQYDSDDYLVYTLTPMGKIIADDYLSRFTAEEKRELEEIAEIFEQECGVPIFAHA